MNRIPYAPKLAKKPVNKRPSRFLALLGLSFLILEALLVVPGIWRGVFLVRFWLYILTGALSILFFLASLTVRAFQARKYEMTMKVIGITLIGVFIVIAYSAGAWIYGDIHGGVGQGVFDSPSGEYGLYVCRLVEYDAEGNEISAEYRGYRCFDRQVYIYDEEGVPAADGFQVEWTDNETAILSSGGQSVVISFKPDA